MYAPKNLGKLVQNVLSDQPVDESFNMEAEAQPQEQRPSPMFPPLQLSLAGLDKQAESSKAADSPSGNSGGSYKPKYLNMDFKPSPRYDSENDKFLKDLSAKQADLSEKQKSAKANEEEKKKYTDNEKIAQALVGILPGLLGMGVGAALGGKVVGAAGAAGGLQGGAQGVKMIDDSVKERGQEAKADREKIDKMLEDLANKAEARKAQLDDRNFSVEQNDANFERTQKAADVRDKNNFEQQKTLQNMNNAAADRRQRATLDAALAKPSAKGGNEKAPTELQQKAAEFGGRMLASQQGLNVLSPNFDPAKYNLENYGVLPRFATSEDKKMYEANKQDWINASLRRESGATIRDEEYDRQDKAFWPQVGDTPAVAQRKQMQRELFTDLMLNNAGKVLAPQVRNMVQALDMDQLKQMRGDVPSEQPQQPSISPQVRAEAENMLKDPNAPEAVKARARHILGQ